MKQKPIFIFSFVLLVIVAISTFYFLNNRDLKGQSAQTQQSNANLEELTVLPQTAKDKVNVKNVTLAKKSFLVVREIEGEHLSQIVEISKQLDKGTHQNITISLGRANVTGQELLVMIYDDYENDGIFNDFDMPSLNKEGFMTARYVKTGKPLPITITEGESSAMNHNMAGMKSMVKVRYTDKGFVPEKIEIQQGSMVEFINESSKEMWVGSNPHPSHTDLPTLDQFRPYKKGSMYRYVFDKKGTWLYHDHLDANFGGVVKVI